MASTQLIKNKKGNCYKIIVSLGYGANGKKKMKCSTYTPDPEKSPKQQRKDAERYAAEFEDKVKKGEYYDGNKITFEELAIKWLEEIKPGVSFNTYSNYEMLLKKNIIPYFKVYRVAQIRLPMIEEFYLSLTKDYARGTIEKCGVILNRIFKKAVRWEMIGKNPCTEAEIPPAKTQGGTLKYFTPQQCLDFLSSLDMEFEMVYKGHKRIDDTGKPYYVNDYIEKRRMSTQFKVFYNIALFCGLRKGELLALHWNDIDFNKLTLQVHQSLTSSDDGVKLKETKTASGMRIIAFPESLLPLLKQYKVEYNLYRMQLGSYWKGSDNIFTQADGSYMCLSTPYQKFKNHIRRYNEWVDKENKKHGNPKYEKLPDIPLHGLRHSCATLLNSLGTNLVDISKILGHAQTSTTMNIYTHSFMETRYEASRKIDAFVRSGQV